MFKRFYEAKKTKVAVAVDNTHVVKDSRTHNIIARGDAETCQRFVNSFGECYVEAAQ